MSFFWVGSANHRSTRFSQDALVGVKCGWNPGMGRQPLLDVGCLVGRVVVEDQVDLEAGRNLLVEFGEELLELGGPVAAVERADDLAGGRFQGCEQGGGAGADVVVAAAFGDAGHHRQDRLGPVQGPDLRLLVHTEHQCLLRRVEAEADDVADLVDGQRVGGQLERLRPVRSKGEGPPDPRDR
ncbi:hypothetical protein J2S47_004181 [Streptomyces griseoviridis]|uniref:Uncharacterized protein n=1 Tax=Streptomyces griseoviridis TaxID=45398 RepID=A0ABT9LIY7_STRGD|nr:hypothetical protein [Streptomyces griseoviridis]